MLIKIGIIANKSQVYAQLRLCNQVGGNQIYPRSSQPLANLGILLVTAVDMCRQQEAGLQGFIYSTVDNKHTHITQTE